LTDLAKLCEALQCKNKDELADALTQLWKEGLIAVRKPIEPDPHPAFAEHGIQARSALQVCMEVRDESEVASLEDEPFEISSTFDGRILRDYLDQKEQRRALGIPDDVAFRTTAAAAPVAADWMNPTGRVASALADPDLGSLRKMAVEAARARADAWGAGAIAGAPPMAWQKDPYLEEARRSFAKLDPERLSLMREIADRDRLFAGMQPVLDSYRGISSQLEQAILTCDLIYERTWGAAGLSGLVERQRRLSAGILDIALPLATTAAKHWSPELLARRLPLLEHTLQNVAAFEDLRMAAGAMGRPLTSLADEQLAVAGDFVLGYPRFVRGLPPAIPAKREPEIDKDRDQGINTRIAARLKRLDPRLYDLHRRSWAAMAAGDAAAMRMAAGGMRELCTEVLHRLAPDERVLKSEAWLNRKDRKLTKPTRAMRLAVIVKRQPQLLVLQQFDESMKCANEFTHTFADAPELVRLHMAVLENWIYLMLISADDEHD
jgi:hypothetical protein